MLRSYVISVFDATCIMTEMKCLVDAKNERIKSTMICEC